MTLKEKFYELLYVDARSAAAGSLGVLLGYNVVTKPRCIFYQNPPREPQLPLITYFINTQTGHFPRDVYYSVTAWGEGSQINPILERVWDILQKSAESFGILTDFSLKQIVFDWSGPEVYDPDLKCYYQQYRFKLIAVRI